MKRFLTLSLVLAFGVFSIGCDSGGDNDIEVPLPREVADEDYITTESGLKYYDFTVGDGAAADSGSTAVVHYSLWLADGTLIETSRLGRGQPFQFEVGADNLIPGWNEGLSSMNVGGDRQFVVPPDLAWGPSGRDPIPPNATVTFEVALLQVGEASKSGVPPHEASGHFTRTLPQ